MPAEATQTEATLRNEVKRTYKPWTTTEEAFMREHYPSKGGGQVARELGRPYQSVNQKASLMGLRRKYVDMADWSLEQIKAHCRVDRTDEDSCWVWRGYANTEDYPYLTSGGKVVAGRKHVFELAQGKPVRRGHGVSMTCENTLCMNPAHMVQRPRQKIMQANMSEVLRVAKITASQRRNGKLNEEKVQHILSSPESAVALAPQMGVSTGVIYRVRRGEAWGALLARGANQQQLRKAA